MQKITLPVLFGAVFAVAACDVPSPEPVVASFNEASVGIRLNGAQLDFASAEVKKAAFTQADAKAAEICRRGPNRRADFVSTRTIPTGQYTYEIERLYLCLR